MHVLVQRIINKTQNLDIFKNEFSVASVGVQ